MRIIARKTIDDFATKHPETQAALDRWREIAKPAQWTSIQDVLGDFASAKAINGERIRFEVAGGNYRMIVAFDFKWGDRLREILGTHKEYEAIDARTISQF